MNWTLLVDCFGLSVIGLGLLFLFAALLLVHDYLIPLFAASSFILLTTFFPTFLVDGLE